MPHWKVYVVGDIVIGGALTFLVSWGLHAFVKTVDRGTEISRILWMPAVLGFLERLIYSMLVQFAVPGAAGFIGSWVAIKAVGGWAAFSSDKSKRGRVVFTAGLMGSAVSIIVGVLCGLLASGKVTL